LSSPEAKPINHPANLTEVYVFAAELRDLALEDLAKAMEQNFIRLFGGLIQNRRTIRS
jgi:Tat protein secretion system quality control protein TatD with DNase activity